VEEFQWYPFANWGNTFSIALPASQSEKVKERQSIVEGCVVAL
jgi:hypothetical protein